MRAVAIGDFADVQLGKMLDARRETGTLAQPYLRNANVRWFGFDLTDLSHMDFTEDERIKFSLAPGDILVCEGGEPGRAAVWTEPIRGCYFQKALHRVRLDRSECIPEYFVHAMHAAAMSGAIARLTTSATIAHLTREKLVTLRIPLPPLEEQRRIADVLDRADALRAKRRETLARLDELAQSIFVEMFGDPTTTVSPAGLGVLNDLIDACESGRNLGDAQTPGDLRVLKVSAVTSLSFRPDEAKPVDADYLPDPRHFVRQGDLLFSRANTSSLVGATAIVEERVAGLLLPDKLWRLRLREDAAVPRFVAALLRHPSVRSQISRLATGSSASMQNISQGKLLSLKVRVPAISEQRRFGEVVERVERSKVRASKQLSALDELFYSLQQRAFRGDLFRSPLPAELTRAA